MADRPARRAGLNAVSTRTAELIERCAVSRNERRSRYSWLRLWYTRGTDQGGPPAKYNRLATHVDRLTSYLYAPESTRFAVHLPPNERGPWLEHAEVARDEFMRVWEESGTDILFASVVEWSLVYGCMLAKIIPSPNGAIHVAAVDPGNFGVLREDVPSLDAQEAFVHWFGLSLPEIARLAKGLPAERDILAWAEQHATPEPAPGSELPAVLKQVIVSNVEASQVSGVLNLGLLADERPRSEEPVVELAEVWEKSLYRDRRSGKLFEDYEVVTVLGEFELFRRRNPVLGWAPDGWEAEAPFVSVVPRPLTDYFWGQSELGGLLQLQRWREERMGEIDALLKKQLDPPRFFSGVNLTDEKLKALSAPGGYASSPMPNAKMEQLQFQMPADAFTTLHELDRMFDESSGVPEILSGANVEGVRAGTQVRDLAGIGAGRVRKRALVIEDALEVLGTRMFRVLQRTDPTRYPSPDGQGRFLLAELPRGTAIKVSAHSSSPVYMEQVIQKAKLLYEAGAIDLPTLVELVDPPMMEVLRARAKVLQAEKAKVAREMMDIQHKKAAKSAR